MSSVKTLSESIEQIVHRHLDQLVKKISLKYNIHETELYTLCKDDSNPPPLMTTSVMGRFNHQQK